MKHYIPLALVLFGIAGVSALSYFISSYIQTEPVITRIESVQNEQGVDVYFDRPVYKDNHIICYLSPVFTSLKHLCELDDGVVTIVNSDGDQLYATNGIYYPDQSDLSHLVFVSSEGPSTAQDEYLQFSLPTFSLAPAKITVFPSDSSPLTIEEIRIASNGSNPAVAYPGDLITIYVRTSKPLNASAFSAEIEGDQYQDFLVSRIGDREYKATYTVEASTPKGPFRFNLWNFTDMEQNSLAVDTDTPYITVTTDGSQVEVK